MKRTGVVIILSLIIIALIAVAVVVSVRSAKDKETREMPYVMPAGYTASFRMESDFGNIEGELEKTDASVNLKITSPEKLNGIEAKLTETDYAVTYKGIKIVSDNIPEKFRSIPEKLFGVLNQLENQSENLTEDVNTVEAKYNFNGMEIACVYDKNSSIPLSVSAEGIGKIEIVEFKISNGVK